MAQFITEYASVILILLGLVFFIGSLEIKRRNGNNIWHISAVGIFFIILGILMWFPTAHH